MHYRLHYMPTIVAYWLVSLCAMFMLVALITGIIIHKKIFKDFFIFRRDKKQRAWLDMHNLLSVLPLPFHLMMTYSGLLYLAGTTMTVIIAASYGTGADNKQRFYDEAFVRPAIIEPAGLTAPLTPLATLLADAEAQWGQGKVGRFKIENPDDAHARITLREGLSGRVSRGQKLTYHGVSGVLLHVSTIKEAGGAAQFRNVMLNLHDGQFAGVILRWLYFFSGLMGAGMIATGLVLWAIKRRTKAEKSGQLSKGLILVEHLNVGTIVGLPIAIAAYFWANRLIPAGFDLTMLGIALCFAFAALKMQRKRSQENALSPEAASSIKTTAS